MRRLFYLLCYLVGVIVLTGCVRESNVTVDSQVPQPSPLSIPSNSQEVVTPAVEIPESVLLQNDYHVFQTFNNCGPASLSMALSYFNINVSQQELGMELRPYQVASGDNDDKSVTLQELADKAREYGLVAYYRPAGSVELVQKALALGLPVITRTWLKADDDIGHYRVIKGYDSEEGYLIQDDSLQGKNLRYSNEDFLEIWGKFGYEFLVMAPMDRELELQESLGAIIDEKVAWEEARKIFELQLSQNDTNVQARLQLAVALYHLGDYEGAVREYESIESKLPFRALWYQIEPIQAYLALGEYDKVLALTEKILNNQNRANSELYYIRGQVYEALNQSAKAKSEYQNALKYNENYLVAENALNQLP